LARRPVSVAAVVSRSFQLVALAAALLSLQGCGFFWVDDDYGNSYGGIFDFGAQYRWQLATCQGELRSSSVADPLRKRWMECCMWRHGVPIDNSTGCEAPPFTG